ncbi:fimbria/pilus periplasmic chaperone [Kosakonia sacchari]|uniref:fimbrial biogenesis chaperone n=1 Tax=Kosakonia sacchari TaxID=1158459 RepID=UPI002ACD9DEB|nr:fimbria/pilus periplasmic chaperone [Kosakonia sacchari]MDZ7320051.1 fimbria/pilus periplasmic chaperone [Kosakonia sacchari]
MRNVIFGVVTAMSTLVIAPTIEAAIALDRTRVIYPSTEKSISLTISNDNKEKPYLAQSWIEDINGNKISSPFIITPPMQRLEPDQTSVIRINKLPSAQELPQDRESVFWFNVREIPPKSDRPNVMQVALQTKVKMFYRPAAVIPERNSRWDNKIILHKISGGFRIENPTPYFISVIAITGGKNDMVKKDFKPVMISPFSSTPVKTVQTNTPYVTTVNDYGGRPSLEFQCSGDVCRAKAQ